MDTAANTSPADLSRHDWWRYLLTVVLAIVVQVVVIMAAGFAMVASGVPLDQLTQSMQDPAQPVAFFTAIGVSFAALLVGFVLGGMWLHKKRFGDYTGKWTWGAFAFGTLSWLVVLLADEAIDYALQPSGFQPGTVPFAPTALGVTVLALLVQTFTEEFIFRGWLTQGLLKLVKNPIAAAVISGLLFGAMHIPNGLYQAASAAILGIALALIAIRTGSIVFGFGLHMINNLFGAVIFVSGGDVFKGSPGLVIQNTPDLNTIDLAVVTVALIALVAFIYRQTPKTR